MQITWVFILNSVLLGIGLAMDAFSVSIANGLNEPNMPKYKPFVIAGVFAFFQYLMPMIGWVCVHYLAEAFEEFNRVVPWIAFGILVAIGIKMIVDGIRESKTNEKKVIKRGIIALLIQAIATSIDALSVGFTIAEYAYGMALLCGAIIFIETFGICVGGVYIGKKFGEKFAWKATIAGGVILILIGIEICVTSYLL